MRRTGHMPRPPRTPPADLHYRCFTGDDTGLLKRVRFAPAAKAGTVQTWGEQAAKSEVTCCCWGPSPTGEEFVGMGQSTGAVRFWRANDESSEMPRPVFQIAEPEGVAGVHVSGATESDARVITCDRLGSVRVYPWSVHSARPAEASATFETGGSASAVNFSADGTRVAIGDAHRDLVVWDVAASSASYRARNVPDDKYDLSVPVWVNALAHVPAEPNWIVMGTGYVQNRLQGEVRIYDVAAKRRPVARKAGSVGEEAVRSVAITPDARYILAASVAGTISRLDVRMNLKMVGAYHGTSGSVRSIHVHPTKPLVVVASLDRHVRMYKLEGGIRGAPFVHKVYLKQRLSAMLLSSEAPGSGGDGETDDGDDVEAMLRGLPEADGGEGAGEEEEEEEPCDDFGMAEIDAGTNPDARDDFGDDGDEVAGEEDDDDDEEEDAEETEKAAVAAAAAAAAAAKEEEEAKKRRRLKAAGGKKNKIKVKGTKGRASSEGSGAGPTKLIKKKKKKAVE